MPQPNVGVLTPGGGMSVPWYYLMLSLWNRTGSGAGVSVAAAQKSADAAQTSASTAAAASASAVGIASEALVDATAAQAAVAAETARALAAEALLAPKNSPVFTGAAPVFALFGAYANDAAAAAGGVAVGQFYVISGSSAVAQRQV